MKNTKIKKGMKRVLSVLLAVVLILGTATVGLPFLDFGFKAKVKAVNETKLTADVSGNFKILQVADFQDNWKSDGSYNAWERSIAMIESAVGIKKPDLIVLTGDNIGAEQSGNRLTSFADFQLSVQRLVESFNGTPFVVTFGNHDVERNKDGSTEISLKRQMEVYTAAGALTLNQTGMTISDTSDNSTAKYGTGYVDVYDSTGTNVIERVIVLNSGTYEGKRSSPSQFGRVGVNASSYEQKDYSNVVSAVNTWTNTSSIKCICFQHIPMQEMFYGDSATTSIVKASDSGYSIYPAATSYFTTTSSGVSSQKYALNSSNTTVTGQFVENAGESYGSTRELFNALANKDNVAGIFFGHEHTNTVTGIATIGGKTLRMGYGGGLLVRPEDYAGDSTYADYNPKASFYTLKSSGVAKETTTKENLTYYDVTRNYDINLYGDNQEYISDVRLFAATNSGAQSGNAGYYEEAKTKAVAAGYTVVENMYTKNTGSDGDCCPSVADLNFDSYQWDGATGAKAVVLGYKTTTDPTQAITDIRIYDGDANPPATWSNQELWGGSTNNSKATGQNKTTSGTMSPVITYQNANYTGSTLRSDTSGAQIKLNEGLTELGDTQNAWLFYTKDNRAGLPIKSIFLDITDTYKVNGSSKPYKDVTWENMHTNLDKSSYVSEYPYSFAQYLHGSYDYDRDNYAANAKMNYTDQLRGTAGQSSSWVFIGLVHALPVSYSANDSIETSSPISVPETIYLTSASGNMKDFQYSLNNTLFRNNNKSYVQLQSPSETMKAYFYCPNASGVSATVSSGSAAMSSAQSVPVSTSDGMSTATVNLSSATNFALSTGLTSGQTGTVKWTFTYTLSDSTKTISAYSTVYAPYEAGVAAISATTAHANGSRTLNYSSTWTAMFGIHKINKSQDIVSISGVTAVGGGDCDWIDYTANYKQRLYNVLAGTLPSDYIGGGAPTSSNLLTANSTTKSVDSTTDGTAFFYKNSGSTDSDSPSVSGGSGTIYYDPARAKTIGDIPNFYFGTYFGGFGWGGEASGASQIRDVQRSSGYRYVAGDGTVLKTSASYYNKTTSKGNPNFAAGTSNTIRNNANSLALSDGARFISSSAQQWCACNPTWGDGSSVSATAAVSVYFDAVDKSTLRKSVADALAAQYNGATGLDDKIKAASLVLGDPTATLSQMDNAANTLDTAVTSANQSSYVVETGDFLAPELIYLNTSDFKTFQYFANDANSSYAKSISSSNDTTGYLTFTGPSGSTVTSLTCTGATINSTSAGTNLSGHGFTISGNKITGSITASTSSLPSAASQKSSTTLTWTVTYTTTVRGVTITNNKAVAYTECYAPLYGTNSAVATQTHTGMTKHDKGILNQATWIVGIHGIESYSSGQSTDKYLNCSYNFSPYGGSAVIKKSASSTDPSNGDTIDGCYTESTGNSGYSGYWWKDTGDGSGDGDTRTQINYYKGILYVDTSRYSNLNTIPRFKVGIDVFENWSSSGGGRTMSLGIYKVGDSANQTNIFTETSAGSGGTRWKDNILPSLSLSSLTANTVYYIRGYCKVRNSGYQCTTYAHTPLEIRPSYKETLRNAYLAAIKSGRQSYMYTSGSWTEYENALKAVAKNLEQVDVSNNNALAQTLSEKAAALVLKTTTVNRHYVSTDESNLKIADDSSATYNYCLDLSIHAASTPEGYEAASPAYAVTYTKGSATFSGGTSETTAGNITVNYSLYNTIDVTYKYVRKQYTVTVDAAGGTYSGDIQVTQKYKTSTTLSTPTRTGYTFAGWKVNGRGSVSGNTYTFGPANDTVIAQWTPNKYTVTLNKQSGSSEEFVSDKSYPATTVNGLTVSYNGATGYFTVNGTLTEDYHYMDIPIHASGNYTIRCSDVSGTKDGGCPVIELFKNGKQYGPHNSDHTDNNNGFGTGRLKLDVPATSINLTIPSGGGADSIRFWVWKSGNATYSNYKFKITIEQTATEATFDSAMPSVTPPTRDLYDFAGYYTQTNGQGTKYYNADGTSAANYIIADNTTLYAYWTPANYNLNYDNLFNLTQFKNHYSADEGKKVKIDTAAGTLKYTSDTATKTLTSNNGYRIYVDAQAEYNFSFDFDSDDKDLWCDVEIECYDASNNRVDINNANTTKYYDVTNPKYTPNNISSISSELKNTCTSVIYLKDSSANSGNPYYQYTPKLWLNDQNVFLNSTQPLEGAMVGFITPPGTKYIVVNFGSDSVANQTGTFSNIRLTRQSFATNGTRELAANTITYPKAGPTSTNYYNCINSGTVNVNTIGGSPTTSVIGYDFAGWVNNVTGNVETSFAAASNKYGMTYTSKWNLHNYTITYNSNGGSTVSNGSYTVESTKITFPTAPTKTGYTFAGWKLTTAPTGGAGLTANQVYTSNPSGMSNCYGNITFTAQWTANSYNVHYYGNGATSGSTTSSSHTYDTAKALTSNGFSKTGYSFAGWRKSTTVLSDATEYHGSHPADATSNYNNVKQFTISGTFNEGDVYVLDCDVKGSGTVYNYFYGASGYRKVGSLVNSAGVSKPNNVGDGCTTIPVTSTYQHYYVVFTLGSDGTSSVDKYLLFRAMKGAEIYVKNVTLRKLSDEKYSNGASVSNLTSLSGAGITLVGTWSTNSYNITYNYNSGSAKSGGNYPSSASFDSAFYVSAPTRTGYTFTGWSVTSGLNTSTAKYGTTSSTANSLTSNSTKCKNGADGDVYFKNLNAAANGSVTIAANWNANTYTITLNQQSGTGGTESVSQVFDATVNSITVPTRTGYTFGGYYTSTNGSGTQVFNNQGAPVVNASAGYIGTNTKWIKASSPTLYAKWTKNTYSVNYDYNSGSAKSGGNYPSSASYDTEFYVSAPSRTGYIFTGWTVTGGLDSDTAKWGTATGPSTAISNSETKCVNGADGNVYFKNITPNTSGNVSVTLKANWTPITYQVKYNGNGSTSGSMSNSTHTYSVEKQLTSNGFSRVYTVTYSYNNATGGNSTASANATATFDGWATSSTGEKVYSNNTAVTNLASTQDAVVNLYAKWILGSVTLPTPTRTGYTFGGWYESSDFSGTQYSAGASYTPSKAITLYAKWNIVTYTISYTLNGGTVATANPTSYNVETATFTLNNPTKTGYTFKGWTGSNGTTAQTSVSIATGSTGNKSYTANWTPITYTITYDENGGSTVSDGGYTIESTSISFPTTTRTGYTFAGWKVTTAPSVLSGGTAVTSGTTYTSNPTISKCYGDITFQAQWTANKYKLSFNANKPSNASGTPSIPSSKEVTYDSAYDTLTDATLTGWTFNGWYTATSGGTKKISTDTYKVAGNQTLYAQWTAKTSTVSFNANGGTGGQSANVAATYDSAMPTISTTAPTKTGYTFQGWYDSSATSGGTKYYNADGSSARTWNKVTTSQTLYARWSTNSYKITYSMNSGTNPTDNPTSAVYDTVATILKPSRTGYIFNGWNVSSGLNTSTAYYGTSSTAVTTALTSSSTKIGASGTVYVKNLNPTNNSTANLNANWTAITYTVKFNGNNNTGGTTVANYTATYDSDIVFPSNTYTRAYTVTYNHNYTGSSNTNATATATFGGWNTNNSGTGTNYSVGQTGVKNLASTQGAEVNLYAKWTLGSVTLPNPTRTGYTFGGWYAESTLSTKIGNAGETYTPTANKTIYAKWTANPYTVKFDGNKGSKTGTLSNVPADKTVTYDSTYGTLGTPSLNGYTFAGWFTAASGGTEVTSSTTVKITATQTLYAHWTANTTTAYKVEHYKMNLDGVNYTKAETESKSGTTDTTATATAKTYAGFTYGSTIPGTVASGNIDGDGTLVLKLYYTRNKYDVTVSASTGISAVTGTGNYKFGQQIDITATVKDGYTWSAWTASSTPTGASFAGTTASTKYTVGAGAVTLTASATPNTDTAYKVEHYQMNVSGSGYTLKDTDDKTGTTDTAATYTFKTYTGFTKDESKTDTGVINGDGSRVVKLYYTRNQHTVSLSKGTGISAVSGAKTYYYGASVTINATVKAGYTWSKWTVGTTTTQFTTTKNYTFTMGDSNVSYKANATANTNTAHTVEHYKMDLNGTTYSIVTADTESKTGTTDTAATYTFKTYTGFTKDESKTDTGVINGDGSRVVKLYYTRNKYDVTVSAGTGISATTGTGNYYFGQQIDITATVKDGYTWNAWSASSTPTSASFAGTAASTKYTVGAGAVTLTASATANTDTPYLVRHYIQNLNDNNFTLNDTEGLNGTTDTTATATAKSYSGFTYDSTVTGTKTSGNIDGKGTLVLALYYTRNSYSLTINSTGKGIASVSGAGTYKYEKVVSIGATLKPGYQSLNWNNSKVTDNTFKIPASNTTLTPTASPIGYTITYATNVSDSSNSKTVNGLPATLTLSYNIESTDTLPSPTRTGYSFTGWKVQTTSGNWTANDVISSGTAVTGKYGNVTLVAQWTASSYTVALNGNNATTAGTTSVTATFDANMPSVAKKPQRAYTVTFNYADGRDNTSDKSTYTFTGFYSAISGGTKYYNADLTSARTWNIANNTTTLYAQWTPDAVELSNPTRTGYTFTGWKVTSGTVSDSLTNSTYATSATSCTPTSNVTLTAQWAIHKSDLIIVPNGGSITVNGTDTITKSKRYSGDYNTTLSLTNPLKTGYHLTGWEFDDIPNGNIDGTTYTFGPENGAIDTATAQWTANQYTVEFNLNYKGALGAPANQTGTYDTNSDFVAPDPTRIGYIFGGWYSDSACTDANKKTSIYNLTDVNNGTVTLYAKWSPITYYIEYDYNGATGGIRGTLDANGKVKEPYVYDQEYTTPTPTRIGYKFIGWKLQSDNIIVDYVQFKGGDTFSNLSTTQDYNFQLYAFWLKDGAYTPNVPAGSDSRFTAQEILGTMQQTGWKTRTIVGLSTTDNETGDFTASLVDKKEVGTADVYNKSVDGKYELNISYDVLYDKIIGKYSGVSLFEFEAKPTIQNTTCKIYARVISEYEYKDKDNNTLTDSFESYVPITFCPQTTLLFDQDDVGTFAKNSSSFTWTTDDSGTSKSKSAPATNVYGYSKEFSGNEKFLGDTDTVVNVANSTVSGTNYWPTYTFEFTGTGYTIYSTCDDNSGLMTIKTEKKLNDGSYSSSGLGMNKAVNTYYKDGTKTELYQSPVFTRNDLAYGTYKVTVSAVYNLIFDYTDKANTQQSSAYDSAPMTGDIVDLSNEMGSDYAQCEYLSINDGEGSSTGELRTSDYESTIVGGRNLPTADNVSGNYNVSIDGIRIFNPAGENLSTGDVKDIYATDNELNPIYQNVRSLITNKSFSLGSSTAVYIAPYKTVETDKDGKETEKTVTSTEWANYEKKGANYEVLLNNGTVAFTIPNYSSMANKNIHLSMRSISGEDITAFVNGIEVSVKSTTEQFYDITDYVREKNGVVTITCSSGMLGVGSIKTFSAFTPAATQEAFDLGSEMLLFLDENPMPTKSNITFDIKLASKTVQKTVSEENLTLREKNGKWTVEATLTSDDLNAMLNSSGVDKDYTLSNNNPVTLTAVYDGTKWVAQSTEIKLNVRIDDLVFKVKFGELGTATVIVPKDKLTVTDNNGKLTAKAELTSAEVASLFRTVKSSGDYALSTSGSVTLTAERTDGEWKTAQTNIAVTRLGEKIEEETQKKSFGDKIREFFMNIFRSIFGKLSIVK